MVSDEEAAALYRGCLSQSEPVRTQSYQQLGQHLLPYARFGLQADPRHTDLVPDCVQEALEIVWRKLEAGDACDRPGSFVRWAATIAVNEGRQAFRALHPAPLVRRPIRVPADWTVSLDQDLDGVPAHEAVAGSEQDLQARLDWWDLQESLNEALTGGLVSDASRRVLMGAYVLQLSNKELAAQMGETVQNIRTIHSRDLARLRGHGPLMARLSDFYQAEVVAR